MFETVLRQLGPFAQEFSRRGKQVYLVGGAVRNLLLGKTVQDYDFTTDAQPAEVQTYFRKVLPTGLQHGTVTVLFQGESYEVTTFRVDGAYSDGRRPDAVRFTPNLEEDLKRRDFTINAMALNLADGTLSDPHNGRADLQSRTLRAIGDPGTRFDEDALRLLRLYRFASQLGFSIDPATEAAVPSRRPALRAVSRERIREELNKALRGAFPGLAWEPLTRMGFLRDLFAPLDPVPLSQAGLEQLTMIAPDLRWAFWLTLCCGRERSLWERALKSLTFSNADRDAALGPALVWDHGEAEGPLTVRAKAVIHDWGSRDRVEPGTEYLKALEAAGFWKDDGLAAEIRRAAASGEPVFLSELAVGGKELMTEGFPPGPRLGQALKVLQRAVWAEPAENTGERLRALVRDLQ